MWSWETVETRYNNICRKSIFISDILASLDELFTYFTVIYVNVWNWEIRAFST